MIILHKVTKFPATSATFDQEITISPKPQISPPHHHISAANHFLYQKNQQSYHSPQKNRYLCNGGKTCFAFNAARHSPTCGVCGAEK
jgi:hypothetical protein